MAFIRLTSVLLGQPIQEDITVTVRYRLASTLDVESNYTVVGTATINTQGDFEPFFDIEGLEEDKDYVVQIVPHCGNTVTLRVDTPFVTTTSTTTTTLNPCGVITSVTSTYESTVYTASQNDNIVNAIEITGQSGTVYGNSTGSTNEAVYADGNNGSGGSSTVWFKYTAPTAGTYEFNTNPSSFDTILTLATWNGTTYTWLATNDDGYGSGVLSKLTRTLTAGQTVHIKIGGFNGANGNYSLNWGKI
jgi:hypothetical protein